MKHHHHHHVQMAEAIIDYSNNCLKNPSLTDRVKIRPINSTFHFAILQGSAYLLYCYVDQYSTIIYAVLLESMPYFGQIGL